MLNSGKIDKFPLEPANAYWVGFQELEMIMHLIQIFLPIIDNNGNRFPKSLFEDVKNELAQKFGGVTIFSQKTAEGIWVEGGEAQKDQILIYEVMAETIDYFWWQEFRARMELLLKQEEILVRSMAINIL